jgi:putative transposase
MMLINKAFKYRIYPNKEQQRRLAVQFGHARFVYNWGLTWRKTHYRQTGQSSSYFDCNVRLTELKRQSEYAWLKEADSQVLQQKLKDLDRAYINFFEQRANYPTFKSKRSKQAIRYPQRFKIEGDRIYLPKVGWVKAVFHRPIEGEMKNVTVSRTKSGKYFVSIQCEVEIDEPAYKSKKVGIDLGLVDFATLFDSPLLNSNEQDCGEHGHPIRGRTIPNPRHLRKAEQRLRRLQRRLSRCQKGSKGHEKVRLLLARQHEKVANQRRDFQHKLSRRLVDRYGLICFENLNVVGMLKHHRVAKSIADAAWGAFVRQCEYKGEWYGCHIQKVGRFFPSSKLCSRCGEVHPTLNLAERKWVCAGCGTIHHRDHNAAQNILVEGLRLVNSSTVGATGINAGGESVRPELVLPIQAVSLKPEAHPL